MKLDTSGLEAPAPILGGIDDLSVDFAAAPSFDLPGCADVSSSFAWLSDFGWTERDRKRFCVLTLFFCSV